MHLLQVSLALPEASPWVVGGDSLHLHALSPPARSSVPSSSSCSRVPQVSPRQFRTPQRLMATSCCSPKLTSLSALFGTRGSRGSVSFLLLSLLSCCLLKVSREREKAQALEFHSSHLCGVHLRRDRLGRSALVPACLLSWVMLPFSLL